MNVLEQAVSTLENGWCKASLNDGDKFCAVGAIAHNLGVDVNNIMNNIDDDDAYNVVKNSEAGYALATEIVNSEWMERQDIDTCDTYEWDYSQGNYDEIIYYFNDQQDDPGPVIEMMKYAAKRLDAKV